MKLKVTNRLTYPDARKLYEQQRPEFTFAKVVQSMTAKPETKTSLKTILISLKVRKSSSQESPNQAPVLKQHICQQIHKTVKD